MAANKGGLNLPIRVNDKDVKKSFKEINREYYKLRGSVNKLEEGTDEWVDANKRLAKVEADRKGMIQRQRAYREEIVKTTDATEDNTAAMNDFTENASQAFSSLMSGDLVGFQEGMNGVKGGIKGATKAAWGFIATPIGAAIAALAGIALATKEWFDYNTEAAEANRITQQLTQLSGDALDQARVRAEAIEKTFGVDFKQNLEVARNLVNAFGISYEEAFDKIENGLIRGGKENGEFLDSLREYPRLFAQAGFTVEEFQRIVNTGIDEGIYSDKLPDAIKEFSLAIMEETTASREAMENAFGKKFTDEIFGNIQNGSITSKDALQLIAAEAENIGLNAQQAQLLTADLFKGAGEDAGGALVIFEAVNKALNEEERQLTSLEEQLKRTSDANVALGKAKDEALKSDSFAKLSNDASIAWTKIKTAFYNGLSFITDSWESLMQFQTRTLSQIIAVIAAFPTVVTTAMIDVKNEVFDVIKTFGSLGTVMNKLVSFDFSGAKAAAVDFKNSFIKEAGDIADSATKAVDSILRISSETGKMVDENFERARQGAGEELRNPEEEIEVEAQKRIEQEKEVRRRVESALNEWEAEKREGNEVDPFEKAKEIAQKELDYFEQQEGKKTAIKREQAQQRTALEEYFANQEKKIQEKKVEWNKLSEEQKLQAVTGGLAAAAEAFNEGSAAWKAAKIAETTVATYQGAQNAFTSLSAIPVVGPALGAAAAGAAIVAGLKRVSSIASTKTPEVPKPKKRASFALGGDTGPGMPWRDETGERPAGIVHGDEYVVPRFVRQDPEVPQILDYLETKRKKKLGLYAEGGDVSDNETSNNSPGNSGNDPMLVQAIYLLMDRLNIPLEANVFFGPEAELKRQEQQKKLDKIKNRNRVKTSIT